MKGVHTLGRLGIRSKDSSNGGFMDHHNSESSLLVEVKSMKHLDLSLMECKEYLFFVSLICHSPRQDGVLRYQRRLCVPNVDDLRKIMVLVILFIWVLQRSIMTLENCFGGKDLKGT